MIAPARSTRKPVCARHADRRDQYEHYRKYAGTAPVHLLFALRQALDMLSEEGLENIYLRHRLLAEAVPPRGH